MPNTSGLKRLAKGNSPTRRTTTSGRAATIRVCGRLEVQSAANQLRVRLYPNACLYPKGSAQMGRHLRRIMPMGAGCMHGVSVAMG